MNRLQQIINAIEEQTQPPVDQWRPERVGEIDIHIDSNGNWTHEGGHFERQSLVSLFASILWHESGEYYLVTPAEKLRIVVDDVPFLIQQAELADGAWVVTTNVSEQVVISHANPVELREYQGVLLPYVRVRYDLWARVNRSIYFHWVDAALTEQDNAPSSNSLELVSGDYRFEVAKS